MADWGIQKLGGLVTAPLKELGGYGKSQFEQYSPINQTFASYFGKILPINALYQDPIAKAGRMFPARIGPFVIFAQTSESITLSNNIASHPMIEGGIMADHVFSLPEKISVRGLVSEFNSNILEEAILNGQLKSLQNLYKELEKGGMNALDAAKQIASGYQKRKHIVDKLKELMVNKGDFRFTYSSNLITLTHMAINNITIGQNGDDRPMDIAFDLIRVKTVQLSTVSKDYFTGLKRKEKPKDATQNAGDAGLGEGKSTIPECVGTAIFEKTSQNLSSADRYKKETCDKAMALAKSKVKKVVSG